jgi:hypothetical protein
VGLWVPGLNFNTPAFLRVDVGQRPVVQTVRECRKSQEARGQHPLIHEHAFPLRFGRFHLLDATIARRMW